MTKIDEARAAARARFAHPIEDRADGRLDTADPDNPPMTEAQLARLRPAADVIPGLVSKRLHRENEAPTISGPGTAISIRLDSDVAEALRSIGDGWQGRANDLLRSALAIAPAPVSEGKADDAGLSDDLSDVVRRAVAGEPVAPDEIRRMAEAVRRHTEPSKPGEARA